MKQAIVVIVGTLVLLIGGTMLVLNFGQWPAQVPFTPIERPLPETDTNEAVIARGKVVPLDSVALSFPSKGIIPEGLISELPVREGDRVEKGALLARIDTRVLQLQVEQSQAVLAEAKANYNKLMAGAAPEEIARARAQLAQAQAKTRETAGSVTPQDITAVQAELEEARATLAQLQSGPKATRMQISQAAVDRAQAKLQTERDKLSAAKTNAQLQLDQAGNALRDRQANYSRIYWENQGLGSALAQENLDREAAAQRAMQDAEKALDQARVAYEQARQAEVSGTMAAETDVKDAQAALEELRAGADAALLAAARARVARAEANLSKLQGDQQAGALDAAGAEVSGAQAALEMLTAAPRDADLAGAAARVQQAEVALKRSQLELELAALRAPIAGTVVEVNLKVGEVPTLSGPAIVLADLSAWQIAAEVGDVNIKEGDSVMVTFDGLPGFKLNGKVTRMKQIGETNLDNQRVTYTAIITPERPDNRLRWNMAASVSIAPARQAENRSCSERGCGAASASAQDQQ